MPFHTWLPDAMEAPTPISALIHAATMVNAGVYLLARFYPAFEGVPGWRTAVIAVGVVSALLAALMALVADDLKRVLAYSTVSQLGYMVYAIGAGGIFASQFHLLSHAVFKALLFLGAGAVIHAVGTRDMRQMGRQKVQMPFVRAVFIIGALALAGLPILNGFWSKELILEAGLEWRPIWAYMPGAAHRWADRLLHLPDGLDGVLCRARLMRMKSTSMTPRWRCGLPWRRWPWARWLTWLLAGPFAELLQRTAALPRDCKPRAPGAYAAR